MDEGGAGDVKRLEKICGNTHHCLAFNSNGILKHSLHRPQKWTNWTRDSDSGLYVLGQLIPAANHCVLQTTVPYRCRLLQS